MKSILLSFVCIIFTVELSAQYDFRKTYWGMIKDQVKAAEISELSDEDGRVLTYFATVADLECYIIYIFAYDTLVRTKYYFAEDHTNDNQYISDFKKVNEILERKYGKPDSDDHYWSDDLYKDDTNDWGFAISLGHLTFFTVWEKEQVRIISALSGDNYKISHVVEYSSLKYEALEEKLKNEQEMNEF